MAASWEDLYFEKKFDTAELLLEFLNPNYEFWGDDQFVWGFRGQSLSEWKLTPTLLRNNRFLNFLSIGNDDVYKEHEDISVLSGEYYMISEFIQQVDKTGLKVPEQPNRLDREEYIKLLRKLEPYNMNRAKRKKPVYLKLPPIQYWPSIALAQHYGAPTRLLDWSWNPFTSAYFAALGAAKMNNRSKELAIWCIDSNKVMSFQESVTVVTVPRSDNPNLNAQHGFFTIDHFALSQDYCFAESMKNNVENALISRITDIGGLVLIKLTLDHKEAPRLLRLLYNLDHSAKRYFPGYRGIVEGFERNRILG